MNNKIIILSIKTLNITMKTLRLQENHDDNMSGMLLIRHEEHLMSLFHSGIM